MSTELTWLGHASWQLKTARHTILIDPFLDDSPTAPVKSGGVQADFILVSHGHYDHIADAAKIANRTGATVVANYEITTWLAKHHQVKNTLGGNLGGCGVAVWESTVDGRLSQLVAAGREQRRQSMRVLLKLKGGPKVYFACDTALFSDMALIGRGGLDLAVLPIGDLFTMGPDDALEAVKLLQPKRVVPSHFGTWPPIAQDAQKWADRVRAETMAVPTVLEPGGMLQF